MRFILFLFLITPCFCNPYYKNITLAGTGSAQSNYIFRTVIHWGSNPYHNNDTNEDIFLNRCSGKDFHDIRFIDSDGTELKHYILNAWNGEIINNDLEGGSCNVIKSDGTIIASGKTKSYTTGIQSSTDNGHSWTRHNATNGNLVGVSSTGIAFYVYNQKLYRSDDATLASFTMVLDITSEGDPTFEPTSFCEDSSGNLYLGKYITGNDVQIFKSTNAGVTWSVCYAELAGARQHVHSIGYDSVSNRLYAGLDSDGSTKRLIISDDNGVNWSVLQEGTDWDSRVIYCGDGFRLFAAGAPGGATKLRRTTDDENFTFVLETTLSNQKIVKMNDNLYLFADTINVSGRDNYAKIFKSSDNGLTWNLIHVLPEEPSDDVFGVGLGYGLYTFNYGKPTLSTESFLFLHFRGNTLSYPNARMFDGGDHYQTVVYVKIPSLPAAGKTIKITYGDLVKENRSNITNFTTLLTTIYSDDSLNIAESTVTLDHTQRSDNDIISGCTANGIIIN